MAVDPMTRSFLTIRSCAHRSASVVPIRQRFKSRVLQPTWLLAQDSYRRNVTSYSTFEATALQQWLFLDQVE